MGFPSLEPYQFSYMIIILHLKHTGPSSYPMVWEFKVWISEIPIICACEGYWIYSLGFVFPYQLRMTLSWPFMHTKFTFCLLQSTGNLVLVDLHLIAHSYLLHVDEDFKRWSFLNCFQSLNSNNEISWHLDVELISLRSQFAKRPSCCQHKIDLQHK